MRKTLLTLIAAAVSLVLSAEQPRLVVIVSVDGLRARDLAAYRSSIETRGFARIVDAAAFRTDRALTNYVSTAAAPFYATLMTGATPNMHGIVAPEFYSTIDNSRISCIADPGREGIATAAEVSPRLIEASTLADRLKCVYPTARVNAIAPRAEAAIMLGGHLADAAVWIDPETEQFCTSTYYNHGLPAWAARQNAAGAIHAAIGTPWQPQDNITTYHNAPLAANTWGLARPIFREVESARDLLNTPAVNDLITSLAISALRDEGMGTDESPDLLMVELRLSSADDRAGRRTAESEDAYRRMDRNIVSLLDAIDISVGLDNAVVVLTAPPAVAESRADANPLMPHPVFHNERTMALLNAYLMALYGQGRWVSAYHDRQIYLNQTLIEQQSIREDEIQDRVAQFMLEFGAVQTARAAHTLALPEAATGLGLIARQANSLYKHRSGDVVLTLRPGGTDDTGPRIESFTPVTVPIAILAPGEQMEATGRVLITELCPTLCRILAIDPPEAATEAGF